MLCRLYSRGTAGIHTLCEIAAACSGRETFECQPWSLTTQGWLPLLLKFQRDIVKKIKSRIAMAKAAFNKKKNLFTSKLELNLRKRLVRCYVWSIALYGAETWTLRATDQKHLESFEMWCWSWMEKISWTDHVRNEEVFLESMNRGISYMK